MPVPWIKTKGSKVSQLVADRINSSKIGGSLVIETGFPTFLVDLFHKNRDRMKKSTNKKRPTGQDPVIMPPVAPSSSLILNNLLNSSDSDSNLPNLCPKKLVKSLKFSKKLANQEMNSMKMANPQKCSATLVNPGKHSLKLANPEKCSTKLANLVANPVVNPEKSSMEMANPVANRGKVFVAVLKIFFVVVLAMGTNRLVVGVSMSAFSLFFIEYLGKYVYGLLKPRSDSKKMDKRVLSFVGDKGDNLEGEGIDSDCCGLVKGHNLNDQSAEKQIVQADSNLDPPVAQSTNVDCDKGLEFGEMDSKKGVLEKEEDCKSEFLESKCKGSRRARMKSKLKKLVSKKLLKAKKNGSDSKSEEPDSTEEDKYKEKERGKDFEQSKCHGELSDDGTDFLSDMTSDSLELLQSDSEASVVVTKLGRKTEGTFKYWVLCLIVLGGLVGGRSSAVVLTLSCCLMWIIHKILYKAAHGESSTEISG